MTAPAAGDPVDFLRRLRPRGPWALTAIIPDGQTTTQTFDPDSESALRAFVRQHNGTRNLYYSVNRTRKAMSKKAAKVDISAIEYLLADLDPKEDESAEAAKARYLAALETHEPKPTAIIDSGNGIQVLWRLGEPIDIGQYPPVKDKNGNLVLAPEAATVVNDVEARVEALMLGLGSKAGTQNVDRILRLPGTTNVPNATKRKAGRVACPAKLIRFNGATCALDAFPPAASDRKSKAGQDAPKGDQSVDIEQLPISPRIKDLIRGIDDPEHPYPSRSEAVMAALVAMAGAGCSDVTMAAAMQDKRLPIGQHVRDQTAPVKYLDRQIAQARKVAKANKNDNPKSSIVVCAADIVMRPKEWLWKWHLLRGAQELLTGLPGLGKSQVQCHYIACTTAGRAWPDGARGGTPANVFMLTAEDVLDQEVVPRLIAAGADLKRIHILKCIKTEGENDRQFLLAQDLDQLEKEVARIGDVGLITIDPITAYMGGKIDSHKTTEVRAQLGPLKDFAERINVAVSTITHPPKSASQKAIDHFIGSQAFIAAGRIGHVCVEEMEEEEDDDDGGGNGRKERIKTGRILFANAKNNPHTIMPTLAYRIEEIIVGQDPTTGNNIAAPRVVWDEEPVDINADEAVATAAGRTQAGGGARDAAQAKVQAFLCDALKGGHPVPQKQIEEEAARRGFTRNQLRTAKQKLGIGSSKSGFGDGWVWTYAI
jgi:putative DNA primase/helicase